MRRRASKNPLVHKPLRACSIAFDPRLRFDISWLGISKSTPHPGEILARVQRLREVLRTVWTKGIDANVEINFFCSSHRNDVGCGISAEHLHARTLHAGPAEDRFHDQELCLPQRVLFSGRRHLHRRRSRAPVQQCQLDTHSGSFWLHGTSAYTAPTVSS